MEHNGEQASEEKLVPQVTRLVDLIDYQKGSVVSREILRGAGNSLRLIIDFFSPTCFGLDFKSPFSKGGFRGIFQVSNPPFPPFSKGGM